MEKNKERYPLGKYNTIEEKKILRNLKKNVIPYTQKTNKTQGHKYKRKYIHHPPLSKYYLHYSFTEFPLYLMKIRGKY